MTGNDTSMVLIWRDIKSSIPNVTCKINSRPFIRLMIQQIHTRKRASEPAVQLFLIIYDRNNWIRHTSLLPLIFQVECAGIQANAIKPYDFTVLQIIVCLKGLTWHLDQLICVLSMTSCTVAYKMPGVTNNAYIYSWCAVRLETQIQAFISIMKSQMARQWVIF